MTSSIEAWSDGKGRICGWLPGSNTVNLEGENRFGGTPRDGIEFAGACATSADETTEKN